MDKWTLLYIFVGATIVSSLLFGVWLETRAYGAKRGLEVVARFIGRALAFGVIGTLIIILFVWLGDTL